MMRGILILAVVLAPWAARAADAPDAVYAKFHRAGKAADVPTMMRLATPALRQRMSIDHDVDEQARKLAYYLPASYSIAGRATGATRAVLELSGIGGLPLNEAGERGPLRGKVKLVLEGGEWKVDAVEWLAVPAPLPATPPPTLVRPDPGAPMAVRPSPSQPRAVAAPRRAVAAPASAPATR